MMSKHISDCPNQTQPESKEECQNSKLLIKLNQILIQVNDLLKRLELLLNDSHNTVAVSAYNVEAPVINHDKNQSSEANLPRSNESNSAVDERLRINIKKFTPIESTVHQFTHQKSNVRKCRSLLDLTQEHDSNCNFCHKSLMLIDGTLQQLQLYKQLPTLIDSLRSHTELLRVTLEKADQKDCYNQTPEPSSTHCPNPSVPKSKLFSNNNATITFTIDSKELIPKSGVRQLMHQRSLSHDDILGLNDESDDICTKLIAPINGSSSKILSNLATGGRSSLGKSRGNQYSSFIPYSDLSRKHDFRYGQSQRFDSMNRMMQRNQRYEEIYDDVFQTYHEKSRRNVSVGNTPKYHDNFFRKESNSQPTFQKVASAGRIFSLTKRVSDDGKEMVACLTPSRRKEVETNDLTHHSLLKEKSSTYQEVSSNESLSPKTQILGSPDRENHTLTGPSARALKEMFHGVRRTTRPASTRAIGSQWSIGQRRPRVIAARDENLGVTYNDDHWHDANQLSTPSSQNHSKVGSSTNTRYKAWQWKRKEKSSVNLSGKFSLNGSGSKSTGSQSKKTKWKSGKGFFNERYDKATEPDATKSLLSYFEGPTNQRRRNRAYYRGVSEDDSTWERLYHVV